MSASLSARQHLFRLAVLLGLALLAGVLGDWVRDERVLFHPRPLKWVAEPN